MSRRRETEMIDLEGFDSIPIQFPTLILKRNPRDRQRAHVLIRKMHDELSDKERISVRLFLDDDDERERRRVFWGSVSSMLEIMRLMLLPVRGPM